jgi:hypothetical protein
MGYPSPTTTTNSAIQIQALQADLAAEKQAFDEFRAKTRHDHMEKLQAVHDAQMLAYQIDKLQVELDAAHKQTAVVSHDLAHTRQALDQYSRRNSPNAYATREVSMESSATERPNPFATPPSNSIADVLGQAINIVVHSPKAAFEAANTLLEAPANVINSAIDHLANVASNTASNIGNAVVTKAKGLLTPKLS